MFSLQTYKGINKLLLTSKWKLTELKKQYENTKLIIDIHPRKLLDTEIVRTKDTLPTQVYNKPKKFPVHAIIPTNFKYDIITTELWRAKSIAADFKVEIDKIKKKFLNAGFLFRFVNETIRNFQQEKELLLIPQSLLEERQQVYLRLPSAPTYSKFMESFFKKLELFPNSSLFYNTSARHEQHESDTNDTSTT